MVQHSGAISGAWIYDTRETGVIQGLEKHNLTRGTDAPAAFLVQLQEISSELSWLSARLILINCLQNTEIPAIYHH